MLSYKPKNTEALQEQFGEAYKEFFCKNDVVVSLDFSCSLTPGLSWRVGAPSLIQKLPFRSYVGIETNGEEGLVRRGKTLFFSEHEQEFHEPNYDSLKWERIPEFLQNYIKNKLRKDDFNGVTINVLTEFPEDRGPDTSVSLGIIVSLGIYFGFWSADQIKELTNVILEKGSCINPEVPPLFREILLDAGKFLAVGGGGSGAVAFTSLIESGMPVIYFNEERGGSVEKPYHNLLPFDMSANPDLLEKMNWWGFRLNELDDVEGSFPLDVVSIYPGSARILTSDVDYVNKVLIPSFDELRDYIKKVIVVSDSDNEKELRPPSFLREMKTDGKYWQEFASGQIYTRLLLFKNLVYLYKHRRSSATISQFLESMNSMVGVNAPFEELPSYNLQHVIAEIRKAATARKIEIGLRAMYWGKEDGNVFVFSRPKSFRDGIEEAILGLQESYNPKIRADFVSWKDGWGKDGVKVEQSVGHGIYSIFFDKSARKITVFEKGNQDEKRVSGEEIKIEDYDLLLDVENNEIYIKGKTFTSKDLPTKKATIELLSFLFKKSSQIFKNLQLPESGYTKYRNELQGKIVTPLDKLLKEHVGKISGIKITGQLTSFFVQFNPKGLKFGIIEDR